MAPTLLKIRSALESAGSPGDVDVEGPTVAYAAGLATTLPRPAEATPSTWATWPAPTGGRGGYVVAPPSVKEDGGTWTWITGTPLDLGPDTPIRPSPLWVMALFDSARPPSAPPQEWHATPGGPDTGAAALERELGRLMLAPEGSRNHQLKSRPTPSDNWWEYERSRQTTWRCPIRRGPAIGSVSRRPRPRSAAAYLAGLRSPRQIGKV